MGLLQVGEIITRFEKKGFKLKGLKLFQCPKDLAEVCFFQGFLVILFIYIATIGKKI